MKLECYSIKTFLVESCADLQFVYIILDEHGGEYDGAVRVLIYYELVWTRAYPCTVKVESDVKVGLIVKLIGRKV